MERKLLLQMWLFGSLTTDIPQFSFISFSLSYKLMFLFSVSLYCKVFYGCRYLETDMEMMIRPIYFPLQKLSA